MSNRAARRRQERSDEKRTKMETRIKNRTYTFDEMLAIVKQNEFNLQKKYDAMYSACLAVTLNAEPINFGRVRVCRAVKLFMEQIEMLQKGYLDTDDVEKEAAKLGVFIKAHNDVFEVYIDDGTNNKKKEEK